MVNNVKRTKVTTKHKEAQTATKNSQGVKQNTRDHKTLNCRITIRIKITRTKTSNILEYETRNQFNKYQTNMTKLKTINQGLKI